MTVRVNISISGDITVFPWLCPALEQNWTFGVRYLNVSALSTSTSNAPLGFLDSSIRISQFESEIKCKSDRLVPSEMAHDSRHRLLRDFRNLKEENATGFSASPEAENILKWNAVIFGPDETDWEDGVFKLTMNFPENYPHDPPEVRFVTPIFHPNVYRNGNICLDMLQRNWSSANDVSSLLISIQSLLTDPNPQSPANAEAARLYTDNRPEYVRKVRQCVEESWNSPA
jgi:ubiquitin-conjugating enzyme E2 A